MLTQDLARYIDRNRALGFKFSAPADLLRGFVKFAKKRGDRFIMSTSAVAWAAQAPSPERRRTRLLMVRRFALELHASRVVRKALEAAT